MPSEDSDEIFARLSGDMNTVVVGRNIIQTIVQPSIRNLQDMIDVSSVDDETKKQFRAELDEYEKIADEAAKGVLEEQHKVFELELEQQKERFDHELDIKRRELNIREAETKTQRIVRLLDRDLVSVIIGGVLLIIICIALIWLIARGTVEARLIESAFLILLGFFFGQGVSRSSGTTALKVESED